MVAPQKRLSKNKNVKNTSKTHFEKRLPQKVQKHGVVIDEECMVAPQKRWSKHKKRQKHLKKHI